MFGSLSCFPRTCYVARIKVIQGAKFLFHSIRVDTLNGTTAFRFCKLRDRISYILAID